MPSKYKALNDASRLAHAELTGESPNPEDQFFKELDEWISTWPEWERRAAEEGLRKATE